MLYKKVVTLDSLSTTPVVIPIESDKKRPIYQNAVVLYRLLDANRNLIVGGHGAEGKLVVLASLFGMTEAVPDGTTHLSTVVTHGNSYNRPNFASIADNVVVSLEDYVGATSGTVPMYVEISVNRWGRS